MSENLVCILEAGSLPVAEEQVLTSAQDLTLRNTGSSVSFRARAYAPILHLYITSHDPMLNNSF